MRWENTDKSLMFDSYKGEAATVAKFSKQLLDSKTSFVIRALLPVEVLSAGRSRSGGTMATYPVTAHSMTQQESSPSNLRFPAWQREYKASVHEAEPKKLLERVHAVEAAIFDRFKTWYSNTPIAQTIKLKSRLLRKRSKLYAF